MKWQTLALVPVILALMTYSAYLGYDKGFEEGHLKGQFETPTYAFGVEPTGIYAAGPCEMGVVVYGEEVLTVELRPCGEVTDLTDYYDEERHGWEISEEDKISAIYQPRVIKGGTRLGPRFTDDECVGWYRLFKGTQTDADNGWRKWINNGWGSVPEGCEP